MRPAREVRPRLVRGLQPFARSGKLEQNLCPASALQNVATFGHRLRKLSYHPQGGRKLSESGQANPGRG